jgi:uncharacterized membrane protein YoaT (DUF817 family)
LEQRLPDPSTQPAPQSAAAAWAFLRPFVRAEDRFAARMAAGGRVTAGLYEFLRFGMKQAWACLFAGIMLALLITTSLWYPAGAPLARYDFLFLAAIAVQGALLAFRLETFEEAQVIFAYHVVGTAMEVFKTGVGSWIYPEPSLFHVAGVPLFTGFMYSCIGSYICRSWRLFHFEFTRHPPLWALGLLSLAIYVNFFAHHYVWDVRPLLFVAAALLFARTRIIFLVWKVKRWMPLILGLFLVAVFIWFAENIGTFTRTWIYPSQKAGWSLVSLDKLGSWFLLLIISYTLVAVIKRGEGTTSGVPTSPRSPR